MKPVFLIFAWAVLTASISYSTDISALEAKAKQGDAGAQFDLARACLKGGDGVKKDAMRSFELMISAANQGHAEAMGGVGFFYANGIAVQKDAAKAVEWFRKGAEAGGSKAQLNLGKMLAEGMGTEKNEAEGIKWIKAAADQGQPDAAYALGEIYYFGDYGKTVDYAAAYPYLLKAAEAGHPNAQNTVGVLLENGQGVGMNASKAEEWYKKSAHQGHVKAMANLGRIIGPESLDQMKRVESLAWLLAASNKGEITATKLIEEVQPGLTQDDLAQARKLADDLEKTLRAASAK
ncbi:MAG: tetratricopeptide repeat protein [Terrimicrobiaceae bacterium]|nr:sel1 repeat family protein [Terrimicrobiaceae bacterium]